MKDLRTRIASEMRIAYSEFNGEVNIIPFAVANSREAWLVCADAALKIIAEEEKAKAHASH